MHKFYPALVTAFLLSSCTYRVHYLGNSYDSTQKVDVYVDASAIKRSYEIMGKTVAQVSTFGGSPEKIQKKAVAKAKQKGADAVLFQDYLVAPATINGSLRTDSLGQSSSTTLISPSSSPGYMILFLKYTR